MRLLWLRGAMVVVGAATLSAGLWWTSAGHAQAPAATRIGFVDVSRVIARSQAGVAAREQLEREKAAMQKQVDGHRDEIKRLSEDLEKKGQLLAPDARKERQETLERKVRDVRRMMDDFQKDLQKKEQEAVGRVLNEVAGIVQRVGKERGYLLIVEKRGAGVIYNAPEADLTEEVVRAFDDETKKAKR